MGKNITSLHRSEKRHLVAGDLFGNDNSLLFTLEGDDTNSTYNVYVSSVNGSNTFSASASPLIPLSAEYLHEDKINMHPVLFQSNDGYILIHNPVFDSVKDIAINKDTIFYLTTSTTLDTFLTDQAVSVDVGGFTSILAASGTAVGDYVSVSDTSMYVNAPAETDDTIFRIVELGSSVVSFLRGEKYVTVNLTSPNAVSLQDALPNDDEYNQQNFTRITSGDDVYFQVNATGLTTKYLNYDAGSFLLNISDNSQFFNLSGYDGDMVVNGIQNTNDYVYYYNDLTSPQYNNTVDVNTTRSLSGVKRNYLVASPFKTKINTTTFSTTTAITAADQIAIGNIGVELLGLKNMYSVEYENTYVPTIDGTSVTFANSAENVKVREYDKVFTGTNQELGYENVFLGYTTDFGKVIKFNPDEVTYFHYPNTAPRSALSAVGLEYIGSIAGSSPFRSDKIWKKMANYSKNIWWGDSQQWQTGTWLCSWLSGSSNPADTPVWKDRWYNPGYATVTQAATALDPTYINNNPIVWDENSVMTFDPGVYYKYFHLGPINNLSIVNTLTGNGTSLKLHLDNWSRSPEDLSIYSNDSNTIAYTNNMIVNGPGNDENAISFNGINQHVIVNYSSAFDLTNDITFSSWVNVSNWNNVSGNHIISNSISGGWNMAYNNNRIESTINFGTSAIDDTVTLGYPVSSLINNKWHHFTTTYYSTSGTMNLYVDNILKDSSSTTEGSNIYYLYNTPVFIGANAGRFESLDEEQNTVTNHFNGEVDDVRIYDWAVSISDIKHIYLTKYDFNSVDWSVPTGTQSLVEEVERFFKNKLPGMKSQYYNIKIVGLQITNTDTREMIEDIIRSTVSKLSPVHTELYQIIWD